MSTSGFVSKIYNYLLKLRNYEINKTIKKWAKYLNKHYPKENKPMSKST